MAVEFIVYYYLSADIISMNIERECIIAAKDEGVWISGSGPHWGYGTRL